MDIGKIYNYLNDLSRCEWRDNAIVNGIRYNGIDITQGTETYQRILEVMQSEAEAAILSLASSGQSKVLNAIYRKAKEASEQDYDIITPLAVEALKQEFPTVRTDAVKSEIQLGRFVVDMHALQLYYLDRLLTFLNCLLKDNPKSESKEWNKPVYTSEEVKTLLNISDNTLRRWVNGGWIPYTQMDGSDKKFIQREHLLNFLNNPKIFYPSSK